MFIAKINRYRSIQTRLRFTVSFIIWGNSSLSKCMCLAKKIIFCDVIKSSQSFLTLLEYTEISEGKLFKRSVRKFLNFGVDINQCFEILSK